MTRDLTVEEVEALLARKRRAVGADARGWKRPSAVYVCLSPPLPLPCTHANHTACLKRWDRMAVALSAERKRAREELID